jgi:Raf kinase inhibitor-like YbhB/YbcL family protein
VLRRWNSECSGFPLLALAITIVLATLISSAQTQGESSMAFAISSTSFLNGADLPKKFTCDGADVSPEFSWKEPPSGTQAFALIADDPDAPAGTWTHWVLYDIPASVTSLSEGMSKVDELPGGERQGRNDFHKIGYNGPCPPPGKPHRYFFKLYALKAKLDLKPGASKQELEQAIEGRTLGMAQWMGKYQR